MANNFEDSAGLNVNNHYGPRDSGGTEGVTKTEGVNNEFTLNLTDTNLDFGFPVQLATQPSLWVTKADISQATGATGVVTIGGVAVEGATPEAPVEIASGNTGVIVVAGPATDGLVLIGYNKYSTVQA